ncbi:MAG TPA: class I SAM-dependent methyltransferase [Leptospiraceae bacterium]|nr:class I SAM-dependent methyltransferase [Leptospiraceae bacterium]HMW03499.1 class I SAM-dependent methyltransferase [Leptospiraceae bacterium]HMX33462.1 class I SAM-dependent methyltransferase [Leptospiraceae bacterium]HMY29581.1 class I SAM-dependent methyltransferase [Leptospiraceae bacterium]HMZ62929.1 class I SAM-dependent methyltransferase [Leptospiraceae bacterium]
MKENIYSSEFVEGLFNRMSNSYERMNYFTSFGFSLRWRRQFLKFLVPSVERVKIIDLMTGMGETWGAAKRRYPNSELTALDISDGMLNRARIKNQKKFEGSVKIEKQDILKNKLPSNYFDIAICAFGLKTFTHSQIEKIAEETYRILKPGGQISFIEVSNPSNRILSLLYSIHLGFVVPVIGFLFLGGPEEYKMLWRYTSAFGSSKEAFSSFQNQGFILEYKSYFFGCATGFTGKKPKSFS